MRRDVATVGTVIALFLFVTSQTLGAEADSGTVLLRSGTDYGSGSYSVVYNYPSTVQTGSNLTIQMTLYVDNLTGEEAYLATYRLVVTVSIDASHVLSGSANLTNVNQAATTYYPIYPGGHWGPVNVTIPLTASNTGISPGNTRQANVSIALQDEVWIDFPVNLQFPESSLGSAGPITIQGSGQQGLSLQAIEPFLLIAGGLLIVGIALLVFREKPKKVNEGRPPG